MRIAFLTSSYPRFPGDIAGTFVRSLAESLVNQGHDVEVFAPRDPALRRPPVGRARVHWYRYALGRRLHVLGYARSLEGDRRLRRLAVVMMPGYLFSGLAALIRRHHVRPFDLIHGHWVVPGGFLGAIAATLLRLPLVVSLHGSDLFVGRNGAFRPAARWALRRSSYVAASSPDLRDGAADIGARVESLRVIPYGVDATLFGGDISAEAGGPPVITTFGRLVEKKGFAVLVDAAPAITAAAPTVRIVIGGAGPLADPLRRQSEALGVAERFSWPGEVPWTAVPGLLARATVAVVPSVIDAAGNVDGLPNVLLEAMAAGKPVVASEVAGIPLAVRSGENGILVPPGDAGALAQAVNRLLGDAAERRRLGQEARRSACGPLSWDRAAGEYERLYRGAMDEAGMR